MTQREPEADRSDDPSEAPQSQAEAELRDLEAGDEAAAEVTGGHQPPPAGWDRVRNIPGGG